MIICTRSRAWLFGALASVALFGCSGDANYDSNVQGTVTIDGELAQAGSITFIPVEEGPTAVGTIASDGSYSLRIGQGDVGNPDSSVIPSGEYIAMAMITGPSVADESAPTGGPPPAGPKLIADKYSNRATSDLKFTVKKGPNIIILKLDGPWANPPAEEASEDDATPTGEESADDAVKTESPDGAEDADTATEEEPKVDAIGPAEETVGEEAKP